MFTACSSCGLDFTLTRSDSYAFTIFLLLAMLGIPFSVIILTHLKILVHARKPRKSCDEKICADDYTLTKTYFMSALVTVLFYVPYYVIDIIAGAGYYFPSSVHFLRHLLYFMTSATLVTSHITWYKLPDVYEWVLIRLDRTKLTMTSSVTSPVTSYPSDFSKTRMLPVPTSNKTDLSQQIEEDLLLPVGGPSASSTETQITNL